MALAEAEAYVPNCLPGVSPVAAAVSKYACCVLVFTLSLGVLRYLRGCFGLKYSNFEIRFASFLVFGERFSRFFMYSEI